MQWSEDKDVVNNPVGRPRKEIERKGPGVHKSAATGPNVEDVGSYEASVERLLAAYNDTEGKLNYPVDLLMELTFGGRQAKIHTNPGIPHVQGWVKENCPFLKQPLHLFKEFDRIFVPKNLSSAGFRQAWMDLVPHILKYASLRRTAKINNLLKAPRFDNLKIRYDRALRAGLENTNQRRFNGLRVIASNVNELLPINQ
ncbi:hypothetical protein OUZ56_009841 [Daphnia magna]|uniref:Uncharacterized protein n=1 Tax=Daphnia magna TaxID=35525 RepID=A0ABR0AH08_9CRUS|nr:hypothetical protein OUZ56_009841 [Daphnia magna]